MQSILFGVVAIFCALGTYLVHGEYDRSVPCDASELEAHEVCLATVMDEWGGDVIWVDARADEEREKVFPDALIIREACADEDLGTMMVLKTLFEAKGKGVKVVVFCQSDGCGSSKYVREKIMESEAHDEVYYLHGGWKAFGEEGMRDEG